MLHKLTKKYISKSEGLMSIQHMLFLTADALADTFYSVGFVMSLCQLLSILELFHIADGIEKARLLPRFIQVRTQHKFNEIFIIVVFVIFDWCTDTLCLPAPQVMEKNLLLIMIIMLEELQSKPVVCVQLFFWNVLDLLRYAPQVLVMHKHIGFSNFNFTLLNRFKSSQDAEL